MNAIKRNVFLLSFCQALMMTANSLIVTTSALVGAALSPEPVLATVPLALQFFATTLTTMPASMVMHKLGRRTGFLIGSAIGFCGAVVATGAILYADFAAFCLASVLLGMFNGFGMFYRFAAVDHVEDSYKSRAIAYVMAGGVLAAFAGPNLAALSKDLIDGPVFTGSYASLLIVYAATALVLSFVQIPREPSSVEQARGRPLRVLVLQPGFVVALAGAALGYGIMALVMTATPLAMKHYAYPFADTAFVIQWHVFGMYAPSFFTGHLIRRFGALEVMLAGALMTGACVAINLLGTALSHFWVALFLLGVGWNFLFIGGTSLLTEYYEVQEKTRAQGFNDLIVALFVTLSALLAGTLHHHLGWRAVNLGVLPFIMIIVSALVAMKLANLRAARRALLADEPG